MHPTGYPQRIVKLRVAIAAFTLLLICPVQAQEAEWNRLQQQVDTLYKSGNYGQAAIIARQVLSVAEKTFGPNHPDVALSLNILAALYYDQGQYVQAEQLYKRALAIMEKSFGPDPAYMVLQQQQGQVSHLAFATINVRPRHLSSFCGHRTVHHTRLTTFATLLRTVYNC